MQNPLNHMIIISQYRCNLTLPIDRFNNILYNDFVKGCRHTKRDHQTQRGGVLELIVTANEQDRLILLLTNELPVLRARLRISQDELSRCIGISRQTYSLIENKKQKMTWVTYMAFIAFFQNNAKTKSDLISMGLIAEV